jgi:hypothetical protein
MSTNDPAEKTPRNYRNPPAEYRFRRGMSGNPKGRPRKERALVSTKVGGQPGIGLEDRIKSLAIEEAYRPITIREGDRVERVPVIQAILRKVAILAANGNTRAQQSYLNLVMGAEADRRTAATEILRFNVLYKERWHRVLAERARTGATGPEPLPHPDDIIIDYKTGEVRIDGPVTEEQKAERDQLCAQWPELEREAGELNKQIESDPNNPSLRKQYKELMKIITRARNEIPKRRMRRAMRTAPTTSKE